MPQKKTKGRELYKNTVCTVQAYWTRANRIPGQWLAKQHRCAPGRSILYTRTTITVIPHKLHTTTKIATIEVCPRNVLGLELTNHRLSAGVVDDLFHHVGLAHPLEALWVLELGKHRSPDVGQGLNLGITDGSHLPADVSNWNVICLHGNTRAGRSARLATHRRKALRMRPCA